MRRPALFLPLLLALGCAPILRSLDWPALPPYDPPDIGTPPAGEVVPLLAGAPAPSDGLLVDPAYLAHLEAVAYEVTPELVEALARGEAGRIDDRSWASAEYDSATRRLRGRLGPLCALCAGAGAAVGAGASAAACP